MISPPPKSTLFPYTTLFRSQQTKQNNPDHQTNTGQIYRQQEWHPKQSPSRGLVDIDKASTWTLLWMRSEEHTSELQSHVNLVCRLLLEKKKKKINTNTPLQP